MSEIDDLLTDLVNTHDGDPWYGSSRAAVLAGVTAGEAAQRPPGDAHSIWELVLHMTGWTGEVARRLRGGSPQLPAAGDWPVAPLNATEAEWGSAKHALDAAHRELTAALAAFPPARLADPVGAARDAPLGTAASHGAMLRGVLQHDAYHTGQVAILKRVIRAAD